MDQLHLKEGDCSAKGSTPTCQSQTSPATYLLLWLLLTIASCLTGNTEAEPSVSGILPPNGAPRLICDALNLESDTG